ncbi:MAG: hypothetical protein ACYC3I_08455 [Gemmataceae bacterium]
MNIWRTISLAVLLIAFGSARGAEKKKDKGLEISDKLFRQTSSLLLEDPLNRSNRDWSRLIMLYALNAPNADIVLGQQELRWAGVENNDPHALLLLAAYTAGNIQSQLNSGVKRNDRYSGLISLFRVYRALHQQNENFKVAAVDDLLTLHEKDKLVRHVQKLDEKKPEKRTPAAIAAIRRLMNTR